jgi:hypothetical protein
LIASSIERLQSSKRRRELVTQYQAKCQIPLLIASVNRDSKQEWKRIKIEIKITQEVEPLAKRIIELAHSEKLQTVFGNEMEYIGISIHSLVRAMTRCEQSDERNTAIAMSIRLLKRVSEFDK